MKTLAARTMARLSAPPKLADLLSSLATPLISDAYLELINPLWAQNSLRARVVSVTAETEHCTSLVLQPAARWSGHLAGQFVQIAVEVQGVRQQRSYSISSAPERADGLISITVKAVTAGRVSPFVAQQLTPGTVIEISQASGEFTWPNTPETPLLLIAAGSGITPIISQLRSAALRGQMPCSTLIYYSPDPETTIFKAELQELALAHPALSLHFVHTQAADDAPVRGRFSAQQLTQLCPDWASRTTLACGPAALLDAITALWENAGCAEQLKTERFRANLAPVNADAVGGTVTFTRSGCAASNNGQTSLLECAETAGLAPAHGCRMGICHGCLVTLKTGQVRDLRDGRVFGEADDLIQICVCAPAGDITVAL